jgi:hypothetical protein
MNPFYKIAIDRVNANYLSGWCFRRSRPLEPVRIQCRCGGRVLAETVADRWREDLQALGVHPTGRCGFELLLEGPEPRDAKVFLDLVVPGSRISLLHLSTETFAPAGMDRLLRAVTTFLKRGRGRPILFMHIPKTAGTSFNTLAHSLFAKEGAVAHLELHDQRSYRHLQKSNRFLSGHLPVALWKRHFDLHRSDLFTIVREPYGQLHSHLTWLIETGTNPQSSYFLQQNRVIVELGQRLARLDLTSASALQRFAAALDDLEAAFLDNLQTRYFLDQETCRRIGPEQVRQALENLDVFTMIGLTEDYPAFVDTFLGHYRLRRPEVGDRLNRSSSPPLFDHRQPDIQAALAPLVNFDIQVYNRIKEKWEP